QKLDDLKSYEITMHGTTFIDIPYYINYQKQLALADINIDNLGLKYPEAYSLNVEQPTKYNGNLPLLYYDLTTSYQGYKIYFIIKNEYNKKALLEHLEDKNFNNYELANNIVGSLIIHDNLEIYLDEE